MIPTELVFWAGLYGTFLLGVALWARLRMKMCWRHALRAALPTRRGAWLIAIVLWVGLAFILLDRLSPGGI